MPTQKNELGWRVFMLFSMAVTVSPMSFALLGDLTRNLRPGYTFTPTDLIPILMSLAAFVLWFALARTHVMRSAPTKIKMVVVGLFFTMTIGAFLWGVKPFSPV